MAVASWSARNVSRAVFNLTSDATTVLVLILIYESITKKTILDDAFYAALGAGGDLLSAIVDSVTNYRERQQNLAEQDNWRTGGEDQYFGQSFVELFRGWLNVPEGGF